jgi:membrane protein
MTKTVNANWHVRSRPEVPSHWELGGLTRVELAKRVWANIGAKHLNILGRSAELAFYFFLALFPGMLFVLTLVGFMAGGDPGLRSTRFDYAAQILPPSVGQLMQKTIAETARAAVGWKLALSAAAALWSASAGTSSLMTILDSAFLVREQRPWWKAQLLAISLTLALSLLMVLALAIVLFGGYSADWADAQGLGHSAVLAWKIAQWPFAIVFVIVAIAVLYHWGPAVAEKKWHWVSPGSVVAVTLWILVSVLFRAYLRVFNTLASTYGSLSAVIILMLWFYMTAAALLLGAEINAQIQRAASDQGRS